MRNAVEWGLLEGLQAYREEHADMFRQLRESFALSWTSLQMAAGVFLARNSVLDTAAIRYNVLTEA